MNIKEMHIEIQQGTQNLSSNTRRKLLSDEIDWLLNKNLERYIQARVKPRPDGSGGFQVDQLAADSIRTLLKYRDITPEQYDGYCQAYLPDDYMHLIRDESKSLNLCGAAEPETTNTAEEVVIFELPPAKGKGTPTKFYTDLTSIYINSKTYVLSDLLKQNGVTTFSGLSSSAEGFLIRDFWLNHVRNVLRKELYWENYRDIYKRNSFIAPVSQVGAGANATSDSEPGCTSEASCSYVTHTTAGDWRANRLESSERIGNLQNTAFWKSSHLSPISELYGGYLKIYTDESFIVTKVRVNYVKKPRRMSLVLGLDCELPEQFHQGLCDQTIEYVKGLYQDPSWETKLQDNMLRQPTT